MSKKKGNEKEVTFNLDTLGVPIAIIVSGVIIATLIFFASRNNTVDNGSAGTGDSAQVQDDSTDSSPEGTVSLGDDPFLGDPETATVAIIDFSDYQCGYCQRHSEETFPSIKENYIDTGKILYVFKEFPLSSPGQIGFTIAEGGACVFNLSDAQTYVEYHKKAFFTESKDALVTLVGTLGVDEGEFRACLDENTYRDEVNADLNEGRSVGISGTPGFIVGLIGEDGVVEGKLIAGAYPYDTFKNAIEELLK
jgi:protein-disulfide isomerase